MPRENKRALEVVLGLLGVTREPESLITTARTFKDYWDYIDPQSDLWKRGWRHWLRFSVGGRSAIRVARRGYSDTRQPRFYVVVQRPNDKVWTYLGNKRSWVCVLKAIRDEVEEWRRAGLV